MAGGGSTTALAVPSGPRCGTIPVGCHVHLHHPSAVFQVPSIPPLLSCCIVSLMSSMAPYSLRTRGRFFLPSKSPNPFFFHHLYNRPLWKWNFWPIYQKGGVQSRVQGGQRREGWAQQAGPIVGAYCLLLLGDSVTTDHISPVSRISPTSDAGKYLVSLGVAPRDFNTYGARRGNDPVMARGTFANTRLSNRLAGAGQTGPVPGGQPSVVQEGDVSGKDGKTSTGILLGGVPLCFPTLFFFRDFEAVNTHLLATHPHQSSQERGGHPKFDSVFRCVFLVELGRILTSSSPCRLPCTSVRQRDGLRRGRCTSPRGSGSPSGRRCAGTGTASSR